MTPKSKKKIGKIPTTLIKKVIPRIIKPVEVKPSKPAAPPNPSLRLYRRIAGGFIGAVLLLFVLILLLSTTKATIIVTPKPREVTANFLIDVVKEAVGEGEVLGSITEQVFEQAKTFTVNGGEAKEVLDKSGGVVIIKNESSRNQPLVATTRLLSSGGVLFRLDNGVMVPSSGQVEVLVHADQVGPTGDIGPDKFTIPGLATSLQTQIYAESSVAMTGGLKMVEAVTEEILENFANQLSGEIAAFGQEQLRIVGKENFNGEAFLVEVLSKESDTQPGEEKSEVAISMKVKITGVFFDGTALEKLSQAKLYESLEDGFAFPDSESGGLTIAVDSVQSGLKQASLRVEAVQVSLVSNTNVFLQPEALVGKTAKEVENYLVSAGLAEKVSVSLFPPWLGRVPSMVDHVTVEVKE